MFCSIVFLSIFFVRLRRGKVMGQNISKVRYRNMLLCFPSFLHCRCVPFTEGTLAYISHWAIKSFRDCSITKTTMKGKKIALLLLFSVYR